MAETDTRLETLEDEVKVLKGEVKRTLVDLRALLMREDSPLGEGAAAKRMAMHQVIPANEAPGPAAVPPPTPAPVPGAPPLPGPATAGPGLGAFPDPAPQQAMPQEMPGPGPEASPEAMPYPQAFSPPGAPPVDNPAAVPQRERMMVEQNGEDEIPNVLEDSFEEDEPDDELEEDEPIKAPVRKGRSKLSKVDPKVGLEKGPHPDQEAREGEVYGENKSGSRVKSERVTSIYDEYRELLEETKQTHTIEDQSVGPPLDVNLMANLVYWASLAKQRVGEAQLKDILQLYIQSGHSRPELQDLLLQICKMVDVESAVIEENGSDWVDLLFHLHGILTGGFPVMKIPYVRLPAQEEA